MSKFDQYFLMKPEDAIEYVKTRFSFFDSESDLRAYEIGDGNLNYIFRISDIKSSKSLVIKQSGDTARISDQFKVSPDRNRIEYNILKLYNELVPGLVPKVYSFDAILNATLMEDLSDHIILRKAYKAREQFPNFSDHMSTFLARTLLLTSDAVLKPKKKKDLVKDYINPDLCEITEDLIFTEPFEDIRHRNDVFPLNKSFVEKEIYGDQKLHLETAKLKEGFLSHTQALIHGDLHTGSIFVRPESTKIIDPEFAYFGPAGFDLGNLLANLLFAWANGRAEITDKKKSLQFQKQILQTFDEVITKFKIKWLNLWPEVITESTAKIPGYAQWVLQGILSDAAGCAGLELTRRIVGFAHVSDIVSIEDEIKRRDTERLLLRLAKDFILEREQIQQSSDYLKRIAKREKQWPLK